MTHVLIILDPGCATTAIETELAFDNLYPDNTDVRNMREELGDDTALETGLREQEPFDRAATLIAAAGQSGTYGDTKVFIVLTYGSLGGPRKVNTPKADFAIARFADGSMLRAIFLPEMDMMCWFVPGPQTPLSIKTTDRIKDFALLVYKHDPHR